jgi:hypothetical protein
MVVVEDQDQQRLVSLIPYPALSERAAIGSFFNIKVKTFH